MHVEQGMTDYTAPPLCEKKRRKERRKGSRFHGKGRAEEEEEGV